MPPSIKAAPAKRRGRPSKKNRYDTDPATKWIVWARAAGHCELCGDDLTRDLRVATSIRWGEAAHILPASPKGPRGGGEHDAAQAEAKSNDPDNLMLACPGCHTKADTNDEGYPAEDLSALHAAQVDRIALAARTPQAAKAITLVVLSQHFQTKNLIAKGDLERAMSAEGITAISSTPPVILPQPIGARGGDYWKAVFRQVRHEISRLLETAKTFHGDVPLLAVLGLADIPALIVVGQAIGDRMPRQPYSFHRISGVQWADTSSPPPAFRYTPPPDGDGPIAFVLSISATIPERDVFAALPDARIAVLTVPDPSTLLVKNRKVIHAFVEALQTPLSGLEAMTADPIHVFPAIPAAFAIEFGAFLTMQHRHPYLVYDRTEDDRFAPALTLGSSQEVPHAT